MPGAEELLSAVSARGVVLVEGHEVGHIEGFDFFPDPAAQGQEKKLVLRAARRALGSEMPRRIRAPSWRRMRRFSICRPADHLGGRGDRAPAQGRQPAAPGG